MPPKPACKVVKRQGQTGARIDPKGCKVRSEKDAAGKVKTTNKQGQQKHKTTHKGREHWILISGKKPQHATVRSNWDTYTREKIRDFGHENKQAHRILYDTVLTGTLMTPHCSANWARIPTAQTTSGIPRDMARPADR